MPHLLSLILQRVSCTLREINLLGPSKVQNIPGLDTENVSCRRFSRAEMQSATNNFDDALVIGRGGFGTVYKGSIDNGATIVAVKRSDVGSRQGKIEFQNEVKILCKLAHRHIVTLIGYCFECGEMIIVYKYITGGSLAYHLYQTSRNESDTNICHLTWEQRLKICIGVARGLLYLHTGISESVIHGDVKPSNILLDEKGEPKIIDFGLSRGITNHLTSHVSTEVQGTMGYLDPNLFSTNRLTEKSDVYAFGVVLFELLCGRRPIDMSVENEQKSLLLWAQRCFENGNLDRLIDPSLSGQISADCLKDFVEIANKCVQINPNERPSMDFVVESLELTLASKPEGRFEGIITKERPSMASVMESIDLTSFELSLASKPEGRFEGIITEERPSMAVVAKRPELVSASKPKERLLGILTKVFGATGRGHRRDNCCESGPLKESSLKTHLHNETQLCREFSLTEIQGATNDFNEGLLVGQGCSSRVYKGFLDGGAHVVAVKRFREKTSQNRRKVVTETQVQSLLRDLNAVCLIGFCNEEHEFILVYDYMANGSLRDHLYGTTNIVPLPWKKRLEVCIDVATVLQHLHADAESRVIHRNITSSKLLLDENRVAKVADFTWSKSIPTDTSMAIENFTAVFRGTWGYLDPDYLLYGKLTQKYDVYSFGVVLLEILCAKKPSNKDNALLAAWFKSSIQRVPIYELIDPYLIGKIAPPCLSEFVKIALSCLLLQGSGIQRPSMEDVVENLQLALNLQEAWQNGYEFGADFPEIDPNSHDDIFPNDGEFTMTDTTANGLDFSCFNVDLTWYDSMHVVPEIQV